MKRTLTALALGFSLLVASGGAGHAEDFRKAYGALQRGDYATALREYRALAEQGDALAQRRLGEMYREGKGTPQDYKEAVKWYRKSAEQGHSGGQYWLGEMYREGKGVLQDYKEAVKWYRKAAEQGSDVGHASLALMYLMGKGVLQDSVYAHMWFNIAASNGFAAAGAYRDNLAKRMTPAQLAEAQRLARECVQKQYKGC